MFKYVFAAALLISSFTTLANAVPLSVSSQGTYLINNPNLPVWQLTLTSLENDITIQSLTLNRGNCLISITGRGKNMNKRLGYGQTFSFTTPSNSGFTKCRPLELTVQTSQGPFTFNW
ncbi:hypothetical protein [Pectobacterium sp. CFBP8739]|uniref:hypothetical protein n=1 Tax=Pectobacterium sp. CFBP8739 TaxID=2748908 RepID=UPI0015DEA37D|nr:hypothetical protein [Pectobacterium sp. CFBP8739]MBA0167879.1 hypothetical protein [Pectobacterium sp. CFBP8739]